MAPLNPEIIGHYERGQIEVSRTVDKARLRGGIKSISISDRTLHISCLWLAQAHHTSARSVIWVAADPTISLNFILSLSVYTSLRLPNGIYSLHVPKVETIRLFPPNHPQNLNPSDVKGLRH